MNNVTDGATSQYYDQFEFISDVWASSFTIDISKW